MRAPRHIEIALPSFVTREGKRFYSQLSDEMLDALEADTRESYWSGPQSWGMLIERTRQSERDRDALYAACQRLLQSRGLSLSSDEKDPVQAAIDAFKMAEAAVK